MTPSFTSLLVSTLVLAGGATLHAQRTLLDTGENRIRKEGTYNNDATPPWVFNVRDGKAWITNPAGKVTWKVGRDGSAPAEWESFGTWLELDARGTVTLFEKLSNIYSNAQTTQIRWSHVQPGSATRVVRFLNDGQLQFAAN